MRFQAVKGKLYPRIVSGIPHPPLHQDKGEKSAPAAKASGIWFSEVSPHPIKAQTLWDWGSLREAVGPLPCPVVCTESGASQGPESTDSGACGVGWVPAFPLKPSLEHMCLYLALFCSGAVCWGPTERCITLPSEPHLSLTSILGSWSFCKANESINIYQAWH